jgi:hypothetical protein
MRPMSWRDALALIRLPLLAVAVVVSASATREVVLRTQDNRSARGRDRHLERPAVHGCAYIADETWALDRSRLVGETFSFTVWLQSAGQGPCRAQVNLRAPGFTMDPPGRLRSLTVTGRDGDAAWDLTASRPGGYEVEIRSLGTAAVLGFVVREAPLLPQRQAVPVAVAAWLLAFTVGIPRWLQRRRWRREEDERAAWEAQQERASG